MYCQRESLRFVEIKMTRIKLSLIPFWRRVGLAGIFAALFVLPLLAQNGAPVSGAPASPAAARAMRAPVLFERNDGQADERALYVAHGLGYSLFLTRDGAAMVLHAPRKGADVSTRTSDYAARLSFVGANLHAEVEGIDELPGKSNYFSGSNPALWKTGIPQFSRVLYRDIYPGVDLVFYAHDGQLEFDFNVAPGANPDVIRLEAAGAQTSLTRDGEVVVRLGNRDLMTLKKPNAYQRGAQSEAHAIQVAYSVRNGEVMFRSAKYDHSRELIIDPALTFSTYLTSNCAQSQCGESGDYVWDLAADSTGAYITGYTNASSFPYVPGGPLPTPEGTTRTFVVKLDPTGSKVLYSTYLATSEGISVATDGSGNAYVVGIGLFFHQGSTNFPTTPGTFGSNDTPTCFPTLSAGCAIPFAAKLNSTGTLIYSTYLQLASSSSSGTDSQIGPSKIAVDSAGALYVTGIAEPAQVNGIGPNNFLPLSVNVGAFQTTPGSLFAMKLNPTATALDYATYLDGPAGTAVAANGIALDPSTGQVYIAGGAGPGLPTTPGAYQPSDPSTSFSPFLMALSADGSSLVYATYFGSAGFPSAHLNSGVANGVAVDSTGDATIVGQDFLPPTTSGAFCGIPSNPPLPFPQSGFVAKFNATGNALVYATTLCGSDDSANAVVIDGSGASYVTGQVHDAPTFPLVQPVQGYVTPLACDPAVVLKLDPSGTVLWSTYLGCSGNESLTEFSADRVALDPADALYVLTFSNLPTTPSALIPSAPNVPNGTVPLLVKIAPNLGAPVPIIWPPTSLSFGNQQVGTSSLAIDVPLGNFGDAPMSPAVSITGEFSQTNNCSSSVPGGQKCDINVLFAPTSSGAQSGTLTLSFGGTIPSQTVQLAGTGTSSAVVLAPASLVFPPQALNTTSSGQQVTITNDGNGPLTITALTATGDFAQTNTCGAPVAPGSSCMAQVTFTPTAQGSRTGTVSIADNASDSPQIVMLSGTGGSSPSLGLSVAAGSSGSATVAAGATASYMLAIGGAGASGTTSLTCTGAPAGATCSVPATVTVSASTPSNFTASVSTASRSLSIPEVFKDVPPSLIWASGILALAALLRKCSGRRLRWSMAVAVPALVLLLSSCGGGGGGGGTNPHGTPAGTYQLTVKATSGSTTQSITLTLIVN